MTSFLYHSEKTDIRGPRGLRTLLNHVKIHVWDSLSLSLSSLFVIPIFSIAACLFSTALKRDIGTFMHFPFSLVCFILVLFYIWGLTKKERGAGLCFFWKYFFLGNKFWFLSFLVCLLSIWYCWKCVLFTQISLTSKALLLTGGSESVAVSKYGGSCINVWGSIWSMDSSVESHQGTKPESDWKSQLVEEAYSEKIWNKFIFILLHCHKSVLHASKKDQGIEGFDWVVCLHSLPFFFCTLHADSVSMPQV